MEGITLGGEIVQYFFTGISVGAIYAMVALGFNIIYNATEVINFAQGEFLVVGGLLTVSFFGVLKIPLILAFPISVVIVTAVGGVMYLLGIYPVKGANVLRLVMITIALAFIFQGLSMLVWGKYPLRYASFTGDTPLHILGARVSPQYLWVLGITLFVVFVMTFFFERTMLGKAMSACADNPLAASLVGINVNRMVLLSFALSGLLGAVAGVVLTPIGGMQYDSGPMNAIKGFAAAILGGLGKFSGAVVAGFLLGLVEAYWKGFLGSRFADASAMLILLGVLFFRPSGLFGSTEVAKIKKF